MKRASVEEAFLDLMTIPEGRALAYACYYDYDILDACSRFEASEEWRAVIVILNRCSLPGTRVLDLGAGNGIASFAMAKLGFSVTAIEPDASDLVGTGALKRMVDATSLPVVPVAAYGESLPFPDNSFALVYLRQVLHHSKDLPRMLCEISRILRPGGLIIACREHVVDNQEELKAFLQAHPIHLYTQGEGAFTLEEYRTAIQNSGLRILRIFGPWDSVINHYPKTNAFVMEQMKKKVKGRFGYLAGLVVKVPSFEVWYRSRKSSGDRTFGRMYTFIAQANP